MDQHPDFQHLTRRDRYFLSGVLSVIAGELGELHRRAISQFFSGSSALRATLRLADVAMMALRCRLTLTPTLAPRFPMDRLTRTNGPGPTRRFPSMFKIPRTLAVRPSERLPRPPSRHRFGVVQHRMSLQSVVDRSGCAQPNLRIYWCRRHRRGTPSLRRRHQLTLSKPYFIHR